MIIASSILDLEPKQRNEIEKLYNSGIDYLHIDVMDGIFVPNTSFPFEQIKNLVNKERLDVHLMVQDVKKYVDEFRLLKPDYMTFHYECGNVESLIDDIHKSGSKVGLSIKPNTSVEEIEPYLKDIDLVLIMSVEPGYGGQKFQENSILKIDKLKKIREQNHYHYQIEIDGGINADTITLVKDVDMIVVGSYLTKSKDYKKQVSILKEKLK